MQSKTKLHLQSSRTRLEVYNQTHQLLICVFRLKVDKMKKEIMSFIGIKWRKFWQIDRFLEAESKAREFQWLEKEDEPNFLTLHLCNTIRKSSFLAPHLATKY